MPRCRKTWIRPAGDWIISSPTSATRPVDFYAIDGDRVVIHWIFDFTTLEGRKFSLDEISMQRWENDKIVEERFYYDPAQFPAG